MLDLLVLLLIRTLAGDKKGIVDFLLAVYCQFFFFNYIFTVGFICDCNYELFIRIKSLHNGRHHSCSIYDCIALISRL